MIALLDIEQAIDAATVVPGSAEQCATALLDCGVAVLAQWLEAQGETPTVAAREGFRLLALQRQGARRDPSFNACRETCRELAYHYNLITREPTHVDTAQRVTMMRFVARHLCLFVGGKLAERKLGDFCCASRPVRQDET